MNQSDNTELSEIESRDATEIVGECYKELSKYVTRTRAYASATDGLKAVYRRVVYASKVYNKKVKSASIVGEALKYHPHGDCLRGCTKLYGLNGEFITIEELYNRGDKEFEILAVDPNNGKIVPAIAHSFRIGQYTDKVYHIKFSDGGEIQVTSNHPVFLNHMEWIKAEDLEVGDKLFSRVFEDSERPTIAGENLHELVSDYYDGELKSGYVRHHINHNPRDNTRLNLVKIPRAEHAEIYKNYLAGLAKGRIEMFSSEGKFRSKIKAKNSHLIKLVNKDYSARRFLAVIKRMRDEGVDITESNYESYRSKVYNLPRIDRLISKGYGSNFEELVDCSLPNISELYEKFYSTNESSGSSRTHSATKMIDAARKSRIYEVFDYMYAGEATHINLHIYEECRKGLINLNGRGYQNIHGRNYPILNQSEFDYYLDLYLKENVYITSIEIEEVESEPMYDFTVDNLQNMLIPTSDSTDSGYYNFISVHNSSVYDALIQMTCEYNWFPLFDGKGNFGGQGFCFTGDTKIPLVDGREVSIEEIYKEFQNGNKDLWVFSSTRSGSILPRRILNSFDNGVRPIMKVTLTNGEEIRCTLTHNFLLRNGSYVEAQDLKSDDQLMTLDQSADIRVDHIENLNVSERVFDIETDEYHNFALSAGVIVHNSPAAMRYTEACLSDLARLMYLELIDYAEFIDGEAGMKEPKYLPALLPYCLLVGAGGIPVGMPVANIPPLNALDLVNYYIDILEKKPNPILPIPDYGDVILDCGREDCINPMVLNGQGRIWFKGVIIQEDDNKFVVSTETPNCSFWKLKNKLQWWIDQDILDYTDETDSNGSRHVFTITNSSKLSAQELKDKIDRTMKCSLSYNFIVEYKDGAKQCGINFIISKNLKYLRECAVRKYTSYFNKSSHQLKVYQAIEDFKNSEYLDRIAKMSSDELKNAIIVLGYEEDVASEAIKKPITYLTRSHSKEIESTKHDIELYKRYIQNPDEYLLTLYYRVRDMISANYNKRGHSMILSDLVNLKPKKAKLDRDNKVLRISDFKNGIRWNRNLYLIANDGTITSRYVSNRIDNEIDLSIEEHEYVQVAGDDGKYLIVILANNIFVKKLADLQGSRPRFKIWDGLTVDNAFVSKGDKIKLIDENGNESDVINLPDWERSRISNPIRAMKYNIKKMYEVK